MKAIVYHNHGSPDVLRCEEIEKPTPGNDEVLIKVSAASVNPLDAGLIKGMPYIVSLLFGMRKPKDSRIGVDVAGQVEAVGKNVNQFKPGDEVFGVCISDPKDSGLKVWVTQGAFAEYVCAPESTLVMKPDNVTFEQAASVPVAAFTALQGLRDKGQIQPGQKVLINGAAGGVGTFAVQIAKSFGADVTAVCSTRNVDLVRSIGADCVIDYTRQDFTKNGQRYDLIFDCVGNHSFSACKRVLHPKGMCIAIAPSSGQGMISFLAGLITTFLLPRFVNHKLVTFLARPNKEDLTVMRELMAAGKVTPVIDRSYKLSEVPEAIRYLEERHARGKVIITLEYQSHA
ncbi:MAG TPA: NAD(P)-dependent alcohol dehydrogenase [Terriglobales bacterium]|nr:NAD(P)-dependent alcohol dehydrogenase [Terriglobales bacterium]